MKIYISLAVFFVLFCGCSGTRDAIAPAAIQDKTTVGDFQRGTDWIWDIGLYYVPRDHATIQHISSRAGDYHFNVTKLAEPPNCLNCLKMSKLIIQPDGTIKVDVTLRHPFPGAPFYTGFDVRGTVIFPATRYWKRQPMDLGNWKQEPMFNEGYIPLYFSRAEDGGGQLLNADGFTLYFFPGFYVPGFDLPIFKYTKGQHAFGPDPDSTVNGYRVFTNDPDRRMFLTTDVITKTYHIAPPDGEFVFGYVVDACWTPPTKQPVTDPKNDFPPWANCEDGYILNTEQIRPFKLKTYGPPTYPPWPILPEYEERFITATTVQIYPMADEWMHVIEIWVMCPDLTSDPSIQTHGVAYSQTTHEILDPDGIIFKSYQGILMGSYDATPGQYLALICVRNEVEDFGWEEDDNSWPILIRDPYFFDFVYLDAIAGDG